MAVTVLWHPSSERHDAGLGHPESPERIRAILERLRRLASVDWREATPVDDRFIYQAHSREYVGWLRRLAESGGGAIDPDTRLGPESWEGIVTAAGAACEAVDSAMDGVPAFAAIRPPGHHACRERAMGFCFLNNAAVAAYFALERGAGRVLIVDWDVHHGNGTQDIVQRQEKIRYVSLHQWPHYPGTGQEDERGVGNIFNMPRPPDLPRAEYLSFLKTGVDRATEGWHPDVTIVSAGFDSMEGDPLGGFTLEPEDFATLTAEWQSAGHRIASVLEGGYVPSRIAEATAAHVTALTER